MSAEPSKGIQALFKTIWKDPVWSKIISVAILVFVASVWTTIKGKWHVVGEWFSIAWLWLGSTTSVWNWLLILLGVNALLTLYVVSRLTIESRLPEHQPITLKEYRTDIFEQLRWYWSYDYFDHISDLFACCPKCLLQLEPSCASQGYNHTRIRYFCEQCEKLHAEFEEIKGNSADAYEWLELQIKKLIHQKIRNGSWVEVVKTTRETAKARLQINQAD